ncbi:MAG: hypothetical protein HZA34_02190 [Candidatus Pacebacteria bacterium]|nr:hypothetical protein [Candidatus Paceibacterota bacterium]
MEKNSGRVEMPMLPVSLEGWHEESNTIGTQHMQKYVSSALRMRASLERKNIQEKRK